MSWTPERVELLTKLWQENYSARQISEILGGDISRNAIIGKAHRLGLSNGGKKASQEKKAGVNKSSLKAGFLPAGLLPPSPKHNTCKWPIGDPTQPDFHFCDEEIYAGRSYCLNHCTVAYRKLAPRERNKKHTFTSDDFMTESSEKTMQK